MVISTTLLIKNIKNCTRTLKPTKNVILLLYLYKRTNENVTILVHNLHKAQLNLLKFASAKFFTFSTLSKLVSQFGAQNWHALHSLRLDVQRTTIGRSKKFFQKKYLRPILDNVQPTQRFLRAMLLAAYCQNWLLISFEKRTQQNGVHKIN